MNNSLKSLIINTLVNEFRGYAIENKLFRFLVSNFSMINNSLKSLTMNNSLKSLIINKLVNVFRGYAIQNKLFRFLL
jgi:hypothetical protein